MTPPTSAKPHATRFWRVLALLLCIAGAIARAVVYAQHRSLWYDEAALALNLVRRDYLELLAPLDNLQAAPPLFLWAERALVAMFGFNEWTLRSLPLAIGIATPPMMWRVARRMVPAPVAAIAVALIALSPALVRYAAEVKPYGLDAFVTLVLFDRTLALFEPGDRGGRLWLLAGAGVLAVLSSTPVAFVFAGVIAFLLVRAVSQRDEWLVRRAIALGVGWAAALAAVLATVHRPLLGESTAIGEYMHWYWAANFLTPDPPGLIAKGWVMLWSALPETFLGATAFRGATTLLVAAAVAGAFMLIATRRFAELALVVVPIASLVVASALRLYPIAGRLVLFAAPMSALLIASAALVLVRRGGTPRVAPWLAAAPAAVVAVLGARGVVGHLQSDEGREESRALVQQAMRQYARGEPVWVSGGGEAAWRVYSGQVADERNASKGPLSDSARVIAPGVLVGAWYNSTPERIAPTAPETATDARISAWSEAEALRIRRVARPCVLLFLSQTQPGEASSLLKSAARLGGRRVESWEAPGAALHHACFDAPATSPAQ